MEAFLFGKHEIEVTGEQGTVESHSAPAMVDFTSA